MRGPGRSKYAQSRLQIAETGLISSDEMRGATELITGSRSGTMRVAALVFIELRLHLRERRGRLSRIDDIVQLVGIFR